MSIQKKILLLAIAVPCIWFIACKKNTEKPANTDEFIAYTVNGAAYEYRMPADSVLADTIPESAATIAYSFVRGQRNPMTPNDVIKFDYLKSGTAVGSSQLLRFFFSPQTRLLPYFSMPAVPVYIHITEYGNVGEYIAGDFSGLFTSNAPGNPQYNVVCTFRVRRRI